MATTQQPARHLSSSHSLRSTARKAKVAAGAGALALLAGTAATACGGTTAAPHTPPTPAHTVSAGKTHVSSSHSTPPSGGAQGTGASSGAGQQQTTPATPTVQDGPGWSLAITVGTHINSAALVLVSPTGAHHDVISSLADDTTVDGWSGDGQRALLETDTGGGTTQFTEVDLATGAVLHQFTQYASASNEGGPYTYSSPNGFALLQEQVGIQGPVVLVRDSLEGTLQQRFPTQFPAAERPTPSTDVHFTGGYLETPDGTQIVMGANYGMALVSNNGSYVRSLDVVGLPACTPLQWWQPGVVLASCSLGAPTFWLVPTSGAKASYLGSTPTSATTLYRADGGIYGNADDVCQAVFSQQADGVWKPAPMPGVGTGMGDSVMGAYNGELELITGSCRDQSPATSSLVFVNPATGTSTTLLQGTINAMPFPSEPVAGN